MMAGSMKNFNPKGRKRTPNIFVDPTKGLAERRKSMLDQFKKFNAEAADLDELVEVATFGRQFRAEHEALNVPVPEYVDDNIRVIRREIDARLSDKRAARVRELKAQRDSLKTAAERREAIDKELAALGETVGV
jgi:hypothetical protein